MALLNRKNMTKVNKTRISVHKEVRGTYTIFKDTSGKKYFQIDTYGSDDREIPDKVSQPLQLDEETALFLIKILKDEFE